MSFTLIDPTTPAGTDKKKFGDDKIREFKEQAIANLEEISNYPASTTTALKTAVWTTANRPTGTELVDRVTGYNTNLAVYEYYDLSSASWKVISSPGLSAWTVSGRPSSPYNGQCGFNTDLAVIERYSGSAWVRVSGGRRGDIKMWSGSASDIEAGWCLSDGVSRSHPEGGTFTPPDLRDRFITGAGNSYSVGATGGESTHTLNPNEMPSHRHRLASTGNGYDSNCYGLAWSNRGLGGEGGAGLDINWYDTDASGHQLVENTGGGTAHENRPPYYALCYLYKL